MDEVAREMGKQKWLKYSSSGKGMFVSCDKRESSGGMQQVRKWVTRGCQTYREDKIQKHAKSNVHYQAMVRAA